MFVTFEGIDGSGKSTISRKVYERIKTKKDAILTQEPTKNWLGRIVNRAIMEGTDPITIALSFMADRNEHVKKIRRWLKEGKIVICDRYADSTFAYQGAQLEGKVGEPLKWLKLVHEPFYYEPDLTFLLIIDPEIALKRIRRKYTPFEKKEFLEKVQENYLILAKKNPRFVKLDATKGIDELVDECLEVIKSYI
jgi:dTMP kinase